MTSASNSPPARPGGNPIRLLAEMLAIMALAAAITLLVLPLLGAGLGRLQQVMLGTVLLVLLAGPTTYWRCMAAVQRAPSAPQARTGPSASVKAAIAMTGAAQLLGLALTGGGLLWQQRNIDAAARQRFERSAERIEVEVRRRFEHPLDGLKGLRGMYAASGSITRAEFRDFVASRDLPREFFGIRGFGFIQRVLRKDLERFVAAERADGAPDFTVRSDGDASDLYVVKYIEPLAANHAALGLDAGREAVRREALERAVASGASALSGAVTLVQDEKRGAGFLFFLPVYRRGTDAISAQKRQQLLVGLLYVPMAMSEIMTGVTVAGEGLVDFELFDSPEPRAGPPVFASNVSLQAGRASGHLLESTRLLTVGGRALALRLRSSPEFEAAIDRSSLAVGAVAGALASFMLALAVWLLAVGRVRAQNRANRMTADLDRLARVVRHTSNAVIITDAQLRIHWVNEGFTRITGYSAQEAQGRTPGELLSSGKADPATIERLLRAAAAGEACRAEVLNRAKDGREYWVDTEVQPMRDAQGQLLGFMEISSDVTERHELQERLRQLAFIDGLTGVFNRRHFDQQLEVEWRRAERSGQPLALLLMDVDHFKRYNDRYGHQAGDDCLRRVAAAIQAGLQRPGDLVARYGGEEFACILPGTGLPGALEFANGLEDRVRALQIEHAASDVAAVVTISVGVACRVDASGADAASLLALADAQLYQSKRSGRGRASAALLGPPQGL